MDVRVKWLRAPRRVGYAHRIGETPLVERSRAVVLEQGGWLIILPVEKTEVKKPTPRKVQTRKK